MALQNTDKIGLIEWRDFKIKNLYIWLDIPEASNEEAYQMMMAKFTRFISNWVIDEREGSEVATPRGSDPAPASTPGGTAHSTKKTPPFLLPLRSEWVGSDSSDDNSTVAKGLTRLLGFHNLCH